MTDHPQAIIARQSDVLVWHRQLKKHYRHTQGKMFGLGSNEQF